MASEVPSGERHSRARKQRASEPSDAPGDDDSNERSQHASPSSSESGTRRRNERFPRWSIWLLAMVLLSVMFLPGILGNDDSEPIDYSALIAEVSEGNVSSVTVTNGTGEITGELIDGTRFSSEGPVELPATDLALLRERGVAIEFHTDRPNLLVSLLPFLLPFGLIFLLFWWMQRRAQGQMSGIMSIGRSKAKTYTTERPSTKFSDVAGYVGVKQEITEVVDFLSAPERFTAIGAKVPKGVLLVGPPGTGKTLIARAVAGEAGVPFLSVTGSDFMEMFVGVGASRVRDLFQSARKLGRAIIFIDEIDSIGRKRGAGLGGGHDEREQTLNQMLAEMDGFEESGGIVMMAATNRPDILDPALLRPGRFDRQVVVPLPEYSERLAILAVHSKDKKTDEDVQFETLAKGTPGMSGADLANLVNEAALHAVRRDSESIAQVDFEAARDRVLMGQRRESVALTEHEREVTAYHEGGHALIATLFPHADPVHKVTILPTGQALGVTMQLPEERHAYSQNYIEDRLAVLFGGRMAEETVFGVTSTGAANDLVQGTELARKMVSEWGMSDRVGPMAWGSHAQVFLGENLVSGRDYSDETARVIDEEVERILRTQQDRARRSLVENRPALDRIAAALLEHETITGKQIVALVADRDPDETALAGNGQLDTPEGSDTDDPLVTDDAQDAPTIPLIERAAPPPQVAD
ncbi:ATP-dependent zinc metalloprotease FtsH [Candidatus Poriferisodalis sp.]|uniref:ATP-dependent zinc metalloprotease FtsH n=1 Tax=Candidatus Poriferisodalis sp. TaxID=3101277 RepID=UPI003B52EDB2